GGGGRLRRHRAGLALGEVEDGRPVRGGDDADRRERPGLADLPRRRHRRAVGGARAHGHFGRGLLLPVFPQGGLPRHRAPRRTLVVTVLAALVPYAIGAVPIGWLIARASGVSDIRRQGSGNIGATNVLRTVGRGAAIATLIGDVLKGYLAVAAGAALGSGAATAVAVATVAAVVGNCWSVFLGFRGGKGVATGLGAVLYTVPLATVAALPVFVVVLATTRYVSLASLLAAACVPFGAAVLYS